MGMVEGGLRGHGSVSGRGARWPLRSYSEGGEEKEVAAGALGFRRSSATAKNTILLDVGLKSSNQDKLICAPCVF